MEAEETDSALDPSAGEGCVISCMAPRFLWLVSTIEVTCFPDRCYISRSRLRRAVSLQKKSLACSSSIQLTALNRLSEQACLVRQQDTRRNNSAIIWVLLTRRC